ncbi:YCF48-related protein [Haliea sp. E17]|uniref:YCF48-related protein n=1 Tax=Haliea sp. E17 TaxID=3401576 RepID=UPI003AB0E107
MSRFTGPISRHSSALLCAFVLATHGTVVGAADFALMLPGAPHSLLLDIASAGARLVEVGERGHILYSEDQGQSWVQSRVPTSVMLTRVFFIDDQRGWAVGHDGNILSTADGGVHWEMQREGLSAQAQINEERLARARGEVAALRGQADGTGEVGSESSDDPLQAAEHALEVARQAMADPVYPPPLMSVWFSGADQGWAAGAFGTLLRTSNGGRHWDDWSWKVNNPDELHFNGVVGDGEGNLYLASEWGTVFRSSNSGETWQAGETGYDGSFFGVLVNPASQSVFAYGIQGTVYRSRDRGKNWEALDTPARDSLFGATCSSAGTLVFVGDNGSAIASDDDGDHFRVLATPDRRRLTGVTALGAGRFAATGEGGSVTLPAAAPGQR